MECTVIKRLLAWPQGRTTTFAAFFALFGSILAWFSRLTPTYIALVTALQGYVVVHSIKEDYFDKKKEDENKS
jgi:hypothetical protein